MNELKCKDQFKIPKTYTLPNVILYARDYSLFDYPRLAKLKTIFCGEVGGIPHKSVDMLPQTLSFLVNVIAGLMV